MAGRREEGLQSSFLTHQSSVGSGAVLCLAKCGLNESNQGKNHGKWKNLSVPTDPSHVCHVSTGDDVHQTRDKCITLAPSGGHQDAFDPSFPENVSDSSWCQVHISVTIARL